VTYTGTWSDWTSSTVTPVAAASTSSTLVSSGWPVANYTGGSPVAPATYTGAASLPKIELGVLALMGLAAAL